MERATKVKTRDWLLRGVVFCAGWTFLTTVFHRAIVGSDYFVLFLFGALPVAIFLVMGGVPLTGFILSLQRASDLKRPVGARWLPFAVMTVMTLVCWFVPSEIWHDFNSPFFLSDREMIDNFQAKRATFETLRDSLCALPHTQEIWTDSNGSRPELPPEERQQYLSLMKLIGATKVSGRPASNDKNGAPRPCFVAVSAWSTGFLDGGDSRDYVFNRVRAADELMLPSLDNIDFKRTVRITLPSRHGHRTYWRPLDGNWSLVWVHDQ
jgi:hypothetical protein